MKRFIIILLVLAAAGYGSWAWYQKTRNASHELTLYGNVDIREVNLGFRVSGKILELLKDEGDMVNAGEVVARLDGEPYRREVEEATAQVASLNAKVDMMEAGYRQEDIAQARAVVAERDATLKNADRALKRAKELAATKVMAQQELDDATARFSEAQARLKSADASLRLMEAGYRTEEVQQAKADLARAEAALETAKIRLEDTVLKAPSAGVVITRALEPGAIVQPGATVFTVSLKDPVWVRAYVHEPELGKLHPGAQVQVFTDSRPNQPYAGQVGYISPRAEFTPKSVETTELRTSLVYRLRIVVANADEGLRQGMPVTVKLGGG